LLTLAARKAFVLRRTIKCKDNVDLYFIIKDHFSIKEISQKAQELFKEEFIPKQFVAQLN
jgi:hypothetical protein